MKKVKEVLNNFVSRYGGIIACCALAFISMASNSACAMPFYEPEEPEDLDKFKKCR